MKQKVLYLILLILAFGLLSCSDEPINKITIQNRAAGDVNISFRGSQIEVLSQSTVVLQDIARGEYEYETIFSLPFGATDFESQGEMSGTFDLRAGTKILVIYTSVIMGGKYTIYASVTNSNDLSDPLPNPIGGN
jgi:hypothetical protein